MSDDPQDTPPPPTAYTPQTAPVDESTPNAAEPEAPPAADAAASAPSKIKIGSQRPGSKRVNAVTRNVMAEQGSKERMNGSLTSCQTASPAGQAGRGRPAEAPQSSSMI